MTDRVRTPAVSILLLSGLCALGPSSFAICLPALDAMNTAFGIETRMSVLTLCTSLAGFVIGPFFVLQRDSRRHALLTALSTYALAAAACSIVPGQWFFATTLFVAGISAGFCARIAVLLTWNELTKLHRLLALILAADIAVGAVIVGDELLDIIQWRGLLMAMGEVGVILSLAVWLTIPDSGSMRSHAFHRHAPTHVTHHAPARPNGPRAGRREWVGLAVIALPCILYSMDLTVLNMTVPYLSADIHPTNTELLWIVDIYGFMLAASLITMGTIGDRIGRRRLLLIGAFAFGVASVAAAFSKSPEMLIATRALLGIAGATLAPSTLSLIRNMFLEQKQRTFAIGIWTTSYAVGAVIGPVGGGLVLEHFWWGSVFLLAVPVMVLLLMVGPWLLPEFKDPNAGKLDIPSAVLSLMAVLFIVYGLKHVASEGVDLRAVLCVLAGGTLTTIFIRRQRILTHPLIDLELFRQPSFRTPVIINLFVYFVLFGSLLFVMQYLQLVKGLSPLRAGIWTIPMASALIVGSVLSPVIVNWLKPRYVIATGFLISSVGFWLTSKTQDAADINLLVTGSFISYFGLAITITLATDMIVGAAPPTRAGAASAIAETTSELGGSLGIATLGAISTGIYRADMTHALPSSTPAEISDLSRGTFAEAMAVTSQLPTELQNAVFFAARDAFMHALEIATGISAAIALAVAGVTLFLLRKSPAEQRTPQQSKRATSSPVEATLSSP